MPMAVKLERAETATSVRFRFDSPFARVATETVDEYGGYDGYPLMRKAMWYRANISLLLM